MAPRRYLATSGDVLGLLSPVGWGGFTGISGERDLGHWSASYNAQNSSRHREFSSPRVNSAEAGKPCFLGCTFSSLVFPDHTWYPCSFLPSYDAGRGGVICHISNTIRNVSKSWPSHFLAVCPWVSYFTSLSISVLISELKGRF